MLDHLRIRIPFCSSFFSVDEDGRYFFVDVDIHKIEVPLASRSVHKNADGTISAACLYHPYESVPTHYTGMALKVFFDTQIEPYVEIKASPAKLLQGHNVFGSDCIESGAAEMLGYLHVAYPTLASMLDIQNAVVAHLDVTYSTKVKDQQTAEQVHRYIGNVQSGQTRLSKKQHDNTNYWGGVNSRLLQIKQYLKHVEFLHQFQEYKKLSERGDVAAQRVIEVMSDQRLIEYTTGLIRFEARLKSRWLERNNIPTKLVDLIKYQRQNPDILSKLWLKATNQIFAALRGQTMKITDDHNVLKAIEQSPIVLTNSGKVSQTKVRNLFAMYCLIREKGLEHLKYTFSKRSYHRNISDLCAVGFSKAYLQNLHDDKSKNVIPFVKLIEIDFKQQLPDWYVTPVSQFNYKVA